MMIEAPIPSEPAGSSSSLPSGQAKPALGRPHWAVQGLNTLVHMPYIWDISHALFWTQQLLLAPLLVLGVWALFVYDLVTGTMHQAVGPPDGRGAVLVTGCDSGFGRTLAVELAKLGWKVRGEGRLG